MVLQLNALLKAAAERGPFILVGHSLGGLVARVYARRFPDEVAGVVFVDSSHPDQRLDRRMLDQVDGFIAKQASEICQLADRGMVHPALQMLAEPFADLPDIQTELLSVTSSPKALDANLREWRDFPLTCQQAEEAGPLGDLPIAVITAGTPSISPEIDITPSEQDAIWRRYQQEIAALSSNSHAVVFEEATHHMTSEDHFAEAIAEVVVRLANRLSGT